MNTDTKITTIGYRIRLSRSDDKTEVDAVNAEFSSVALERSQQLRQAGRNWAILSTEQRQTALALTVESVGWMLRLLVYLLRKQGL